jgi:hypothetical protein
MNNDVVQTLTEKACAPIRFRMKKEVLEESPDINNYLGEIMNDERVKYAFKWQQPDGYLGQSFHGGLIPEEKRKYSGTGAEGALRFLSEMGIPQTYPVVEKGLTALLRDNWNPDRWKWSTIYQPELGLFGADNVRAVVFSYYGIEEHEFIQTEIKRALGYVNNITTISSVEDITGTYQKKLYFSKGIPLPDIYNLKLLAFTKSWRNGENIDAVAKPIGHFIDLSPLPQIYIKAGSQLVAPATIFPHDMKKSLHEFQPQDWFFWFHNMELFARLGVVKKVPALLQRVNELKEMLASGKGFFPVKPYSRPFEQWSVYTGLALEDSWRNDRWKYDLTFRSLLILKYAGLF